MYTVTQLLFQCDKTVTYEETLKNKVNYQFVTEDKTLYIFLEPSSGWIDWKHNFQFKKRPYKDMKIPYRVHRGFLKCWKEIEDIIIAKITETDDQDNYLFDTIITVGYSHGAALAMLCHECCWFHRQDIVDCIYGIGFDGPRVYGGFSVNPELKQRWDNFILVRNNTDIVTHVPPRCFGFTHIGHLLHVGQHEKYGPIKSHYSFRIIRSLLKFEVPCDTCTLPELLNYIKKG